MANFSTTEIKFNNESCYEYNLYMSYIKDNGTGENLLQEMNISTVRTPRRQKIYSYGVPNTKIQEFEIGLFSEKPIYVEDKNKIMRWLSNNGQYGELKIIQEDMLDKHFMCIFESINSITIGNLCYGFACKIVCDSPYCYGDTNTYNYTSPTTFVLPNVSSGFIPLPIELTITVTSGTSFTISNITTDESFTVSNRAANDIIYVNTDLQKIILQSNPTQNIIDSFNGDFIKIAQGDNSFTITGTISLEINYIPVYIIGG